MSRSPKTSFVSLTPEDRRQFEAVARAPGWRVVKRDDLPAAYPESFRKKLDSAVLICTAAADSGTTYLVYNALRIDAKDQAVDHEPFAVSVFPSGASTGGMFVHHGDWPGRTTPIPSGFWDAVRASGISGYFYANPPQGKRSGKLSDLPEGHSGAFERAVDLLRVAEARD